MFTWIPIYAELAKKLLLYRQRQQDLIKMLKEMEAERLPVGGTADKDQQDAVVPLAEIDPFTFYACFNRNLTLDNRRRILTYLKSKFELQSEVPDDFGGIPTINALKAWFFPFIKNRKPEDIPSLWALAEEVVTCPPEKLNPQLFERCLQISGVGPAKLTMAMFWFNPKEYIAWDKVNRKLFKSHGIDREVKNFASYLELIRDVNAKLGTDYPQISQTAFEGKVNNDIESDANYWAGGFQWGDTSKLDEFIQGNFWQIGWSKNDSKPAAKKTWAYFENIKIGDHFAIKGYGGQNDLRIHYLGEVIEKSEDGILKLDKTDGPLFRGKAPTGLIGATWFHTLVPITSRAVIDALFNGAQTITESSRESKAMNLVLYGPPGTGKTYQTIERAVRITDRGFEGDHASSKKKFDELVRQGRIGFITFHQSYSYEDFVEGIRPVLDAEDEDAGPRYECRSGIFKSLSINALFDCLETAAVANQHVSFDILWKALLSKIESDPEATYPGLTEKTSYQLNVTSRGNLEGTNVVSNKQYACSRKVVEKVFDVHRNQESVTSSEVMDVNLRGCHSHLVAAIFNELKRIEKSQFNSKVPSKEKVTYTEEERASAVQRFLNDDKTSGYQMKPRSRWNQYVLVIDEINRGNISKILGELITLLEVDKRLTGENSLIVTLPYSGDKFAVPANLSLLATMNTTDKSIALVDVALRRRFEFEELHVDLSVCNSLSDGMQSVLRKLNDRIILRKDRDHQIGHAYFVGVADEKGFNSRFRRQIIPLLQEYFYNDWEGLRYVLAEPSNNSDSSFIRKIEGADAQQARTKWQWFFDAGTDNLNCLKTLLSNYQTP